jgi:hypothetical protein
LTHLREAVVAITQLLHHRARLPQPQATELLVQSLGTPEARQGPPPASLLEELRRRLLALYAVSSRTEVERCDLREAPWLLWNGTPRLATVPRIVDAVHIQAAGHQRTLRNLIEAWIAAFDPADPTINASGQQISAVLRTNSDHRLDLWREADKRVGLFDAKTGPRKLAVWVMSGPETVQQALIATGLDDPVRGGGGYAKAVQLSVQATAEPALRSRSADQALERALLFLETGNGLRFPDLRSAMAQDLTSPWRNQGTQPPESARGVVCDFLVRHLRDPRTNAGNWQAVGEETTGLIRRWLVRASLDMFFGLIAQFALDEHWQWRAAFWKACMDRCNERGVPFDAWVALGPRVRELARTSRELRGAFGRIAGAGVLGNHSVLLMRVGPVTVCDWSHNGALRAWPSDWRNAPGLYRSEYERSELTGKCLDFPPNPTYGSRGEPSGKGLRHSSSDRNYWQGSAAELLARRAGIRLTAADWQPR